MDRTKKLLMGVTASALLAGSNPKPLDARAILSQLVAADKVSGTGNDRNRLEGSYYSQTADQIAQASQIISDLLSGVQEEHAMSLNELLEKRPDLDRGAAEKAIAELLKQGKIQKTGDGSSEKPFKYYDKSRTGHGG